MARFFEISGGQQVIPPLVFFPQSVGLHRGDGAEHEGRSAGVLIGSALVSGQLRLSLCFRIRAAVQRRPCFGHEIFFGDRLRVRRFEMQPGHHDNQIGGHGQSTEQHGQPSAARYFCEPRPCAAQ